MKGTLSILLLCLALVTNAQKRSAQKHFTEATQQQETAQTIELLKKAIAKDSSYSEAYITLARIYEQQHKYTLQVQCLLTGSQKGSSNKEFLHAQLAKAAYLNGQYHIAQKALEELTPLSNPQLLHLHDCVLFSLNGITQGVEISAKNLGQKVNTEYHDYWPSLSIDEAQIVTTVFIDDPKDDRTPSQEDFYISKKGRNGWEKSHPLSPIINSIQNEGAQSLSADGKTMLFTACNRFDGFGACDIYMTHKVKGVWSPPIPLPYPINTEYWDGHPSLSADGKYLFFSSDRKGGYGGRDLYQAEIVLGESISVKRLRNLGENINTDKHEISPFIHADGKTLYFSSNGLIGFGRQDLYQSTEDSSGRFTKPVNLGYPINTHNDEIGLVINAHGTKAYFATEREDSRKKDIYTFDLPPQHRPQEVSYFKASVKDKETGLALSANIELRCISNGTLINTQKNKEQFIIPLPVGQDYAINVSHPGYLFYSDHFLLSKRNNSPFVKEILLSPLRKGERLILKNVLFAHNSSQLDTSYTAELKQAIALIKNNPELHFQVSGHTDTSGSDSYNQKLSEQRAKVVFDYFVSKGINAHHLSYKGYGSSQTISEVDSENRRTELLIQ